MMIYELFHIIYKLDSNENSLWFYKSYTLFT